MSLLGVLLAVFSAAGWGCGDFVGGLATRRLDVRQVLFLSASSGMLAQFVLALLSGETVPGLVDIGWAAAAGLGGAVGLGALYYGLAHAQLAVVTTTSALVAAIFPILLGYAQSGALTTLQFSGILFGLLGIWLITRPAPADPSISPDASRAPLRASLLLGFLSGLGFAGYFIFIAQVQDIYLFAPLAVSRSFLLVAALLMLLTAHQPLPHPIQNPLALLTGLLDAAGNVFFLAAVQRLRLDIVSVLASAYPAFTVLLGALVLRERVRPLQALGIALCLAAVGLFAV